VREALALVALGALGVWAVALAGYAPEDPSWNHAVDGGARNPAGIVGAYLADLAYQLFGWGAWLGWGLLFVAALRWLFGRSPYLGGGWSWAWVAFLWFCTGLLALDAPAKGLPAGAGGALGALLVAGLEPFVAGAALRLLLIALALAAFVAASGASIAAALRWLRAQARRWVQRPKQAPSSHTAREDASFSTASSPTSPQEALPALPVDAPKDDSEPDACGAELAPEEEAPFAEGLDSIPERKKKQAAGGLVQKPQDASSQTAWRTPPVELFSPPKRAERAAPEALQQLAAQLTKTLADYRVQGRIVGMQQGPVVTRFEFEPAPGTKLARVVALQDDLARALRVVSVRVAGNVPGKNAIGIEVPNERRQVVFLRQVLESDAFVRSDALLPLALGVNIAGAPVVVDLAKMPHLLVAGTTGSGKSVAINAMLCSLLMRHAPESLRLILIDPKMLELSVYEEIPHLLAPVVVDPHKAAKALAWAVFEMERRYRLMSEAKVRNITGYNAFVDRWRPQKEGDTPPERLPLIVIVIDELADLMMVAGKEVEQAICRIAQKARAAGIHLILATQRPSVDVITGLIKANLPSRLAFQVSSRVDSRTILDQMGAEHLLGHGDGLLLLRGRELIRVHGAFVSDQEVQELAAFLRAQRPAEYLAEDLSPPQEEEAAGFGAESAEDDDPLYDQAVALVVEKGKCSVSMVQRFLRIGYNRASRLVERMEREGIVSAPGSGGLRQVLAPKQGAGVDG